MLTFIFNNTVTYFITKIFQPIQFLLKSHYRTKTSGSTKENLSKWSVKPLDTPNPTLVGTEAIANS